jgi:hypothetical protein
MAQTYSRKYKRELINQALANGGSLQAISGSLDWGYLETMVVKHKFERVESKGEFVTYRLVSTNPKIVSQK